MYAEKNKGQREGLPEKADDKEREGLPEKQRAKRREYARNLL